MFSEPETYAIVLKSTAEPIGAIGIVSDANRYPEGEAEIGYWMGKTHWGNGYMTEAAKALVEHGFNNLGLSCLWISHLTATCARAALPKNADPHMTIPGMKRLQTTPPSQMPPPPQNHPFPETFFRGLAKTKPTPMARGGYRSPSESPPPTFPGYSNLAQIGIVWNR